MTMSAAELVASKKHILLDFDGPICAAFAGYGAANISRQLATLLAQSGTNVPAGFSESTDPFSLLRFAATLGDPHLLAKIDLEFRRLEVQAVRAAPATPAAARVLEALARAGHVLTIVSNNSTEAVDSYVRLNNLTGLLAGISARTEPDPSLLKPNPYLVLQALHDRRASPADGVIVGDSASDIEAAHRAGVRAIAFVNKVGKDEQLRRANPDVLINSMGELVETRRRPQ